MKKECPSRSHTTGFLFSSGFLERRELKQFLGDKGVEDPDDDDVEYILKCADTNHDGKIDVLGNKHFSFLENVLGLQITGDAKGTRA